MTRRDLAAQSFWSERPLVQLFIATTGLRDFSLKQLIAFAEQLPDPIFLDLQKQRGERSQRSPHVTAPTRRPSRLALVTSNQ